MCSRVTALACNCGFARVAIKELSMSKIKFGQRFGEINKQERAHAFQKLFDRPNFKIPELF